MKARVALMSKVLGSTIHLVVKTIQRSCSSQGNESGRWRKTTKAIKKECVFSKKAYQQDRTELASLERLIQSSQARGTKLLYINLKELKI